MHWWVSRHFVPISSKGCSRLLVDEIPLLLASGFGFAVDTDAVDDGNGNSVEAIPSTLDAER
jgi:hypothetical protein